MDGTPMSQDHRELLKQVLSQLADLREQVETLKGDHAKLLGRLEHDQDKITALDKAADKLASATNRLSKVVSKLA